MCLTLNKIGYSQMSFITSHNLSLGTFPGGSLIGHNKIYYCYRDQEKENKL